MFETFPKRHQIAKKIREAKNLWCYCEWEAGIFKKKPAKNESDMISKGKRKRR